MFPLTDLDEEISIDGHRLTVAADRVQVGASVDSWSRDAEFRTGYKCRRRPVEPSRPSSDDTNAWQVSTSNREQSWRNPQDHSGYW